MDKLFHWSGNTVALDVTATTASVALPAKPEVSGRTLRIYNGGTTPAFIALGTSTIEAVIPTNAAAANGFPIAPGAETGIQVEGQPTHLAAIMATGETATIYITQGHGI